MKPASFLSVSATARAYRIRRATVRSLCRLGTLKNVIRKGRGPTGQVTLIDPASAKAVLGVK